MGHDNCQTAKREVGRNSENLFTLNNYTVTLILNPKGSPPIKIKIPHNPLPLYRQKTVIK